MIQNSSLPAVERLYAERQRCRNAFGKDRDLLHDPALDILLYLFIGAERHTDMSVSSACYAAEAPPTTALRYVAKLVERGLVRRSNDPFDNRRHLLELTDDGEDVILKCLGSA